MLFGVVGAVHECNGRVSRLNAAAAGLEVRRTVGVDRTHMCRYGRLVESEVSCDWQPSGLAKYELGVGVALGEGVAEKEGGV
jgi:hypothetical protein